ncbi:H(+)/Cl(-) exchange transporter 3 [Dissostichus eleginoides]|uniref:H(+)/Cl(-) exchange transporter 3 n=1 Tax=Dissostichus eleginoides TaxID=100907 RepID=A0AAD9BY87_DISEL|nr:H(+)/Cl(-) exchange transporter 3 [Dissostichus eleginoides]
MESEQLYHRGYCRNSYNSIASASSDEELLDGAGAVMDFHTTEDDNLLDGDAASPAKHKFMNSFITISDRTSAHAEWVVSDLSAEFGSLKANTFANLLVGFCGKSLCSMNTKEA